MNAPIGEQLLILTWVISIHHIFFCLVEIGSNFVSLAPEKMIMGKNQGSFIKEHKNLISKTNCTEILNYLHTSFWERNSWRILLPSASPEKIKHSKVKLQQYIEIEGTKRNFIGMFHFFQLEFCQRSRQHSWRILNKFLRRAIWFVQLELGQ